VRVFQNRVLREIFGPNRVHVNVPLHIALSLPSGSASRNTRVLSLTFCRLPPTSRWPQCPPFPLTSDSTWSGTCGSVRAKYDFGMNKRATHLKKFSVLYRSVWSSLIFGLPSNYCVTGRFWKDADHNSTHSCTFPQQFLSYFQSSVPPYTCGHHPGMAWWAKNSLVYNFSLSAHICYKTSTLSWFSRHYVIVQPQPSLPVQTVLYIVSWINYKSIFKWGVQIKTELLWTLRIINQGKVLIKDLILQSTKI